MAATGAGAAAVAALFDAAGPTVTAHTATDVTAMSGTIAVAMMAGGTGVAIATAGSSAGAAGAPIAMETMLLHQTLSRGIMAATMAAEACIATFPPR